MDGWPGCICDIYTPDEKPFAGCPRIALKRQMERARRLGYSMMAGCEAEFFLFEKAPEGIADHQHPRLRRLLRPEPGGRGRGDPPGHRGAAGDHGVRGGSGAPRGGHGPARDRLPLRRRADHGGQHRHLQVHRARRGPSLRLPRLVHAQADPGAERQRHAHPPVAVPGEGERVLRPEERSTSCPRWRCSYIEGLLQHARRASAPSPTR